MLSRSLRQIFSTQNDLIRRSLNLGCSRYAIAVNDEQSSPPVPVSISKETLVKMRKETGYSYFKCRKALEKFGEENYSEALRWIKEIAIKEGWEKAAKLSSRLASQGLCAFLTEKNIGVMVELNCETDFVANNDEFKNLVCQLTSSLMNFAKVQNMECMNPDKLNIIDILPKDFNLPGGSSAEDVIVSYVGKLGEKITLSNSKIVFTNPAANVIGCAHPNDKVGDVQMGRFVSLISLRRNPSNSGFPTEKLGQQICQHVIGMLPECLGEPPLIERQQEVQKNTAISEKAKGTGNEEESEENDDESHQSEMITSIDENETQLLRQPFMLNPQQTIYEYLDSHGANVTDFIRIELGKTDGN